MIRKMKNFEQLLIEIGISYISAIKSPQCQSAIEISASKGEEYLSVFDMVSSSYMFQQAK